jgi:hypothetical protein
VTSDETKKLRGKHFIVVIEITPAASSPESAKSHFWVTSTSLNPESCLESLRERSSGAGFAGDLLQVRPDLVSNYKPSRSRTAIQRRLKETSERLVGLGHEVYPRWHVYVLDVDPEKPRRIPDHKRGRRNHVVYVGQTSKSIEERLLEHQGVSRGKKDNFVGGQSIKGRSPRLNRSLTPTKRLFSLEDALKFETEHSKKLEDDGYGVLGDGLTEAVKRRGKGHL